MLNMYMRLAVCLTFALCLLAEDVSSYISRTSGGSRSARPPCRRPFWDHWQSGAERHKGHGVKLLAQKKPMTVVLRVSLGGKLPRIPRFTKPALVCRSRSEALGAIFCHQYHCICCCQRGSRTCPTDSRRVERGELHVERRCCTLSMSASTTMQRRMQCVC